MLLKLYFIYNILYYYSIINKLIFAFYTYYEGTWVWARKETDQEPIINMDHKEGPMSILVLLGLVEGPDNCRYIDIPNLSCSFWLGPNRIVSSMVTNIAGIWKSHIIFCETDKHKKPNTATRCSNCQNKWISIFSWDFTEGLYIAKDIYFMRFPYFISFLILSI